MVTTIDLWVLYDMVDTLTKECKGGNNASSSKLSSLFALTWPLEGMMQTVLDHDQVVRLRHWSAALTQSFTS